MFYIDNVIFEVNTVKLFKMQSFMQKERDLNFGPKKPCFDKNLCYIWNQYLKICQNAKCFTQKEKNLNLETEWFIWVLSVIMYKMSSLEFVKLLSFMQKKTLNLGPKMPYLHNFRMGFRKVITFHNIFFHQRIFTQCINNGDVVSSIFI